ncbi:rhodanese-like domain-containing protein [Thiocystis violacea]|uniref:rhodanese-like domain-containing protein n=1 Tax=Thiocystis violacea TaxID=13725 RepID=UPI001904EE5F|nr:rhodanese-like domain-containing protein [Thiocystis violacea]MBK1720428.1 hypothetical protein [Thiocystis violacea]
MIGRYLGLSILLAFSVASGNAWSYDADLAASYERLFSPAVGAQAGKALHLMEAPALVEKIQAGEPMVLLDIRTPAETMIFAPTLPGSLIIPMNELFTAENLARLPADRPLVVLCQSGARAVAAGTALRHIGFDRVFIVKGGFRALNEDLDAKTANAPAGAGKGR